ncbi:DUF2479 domain-containing protein [Staphylococcus aureus]|nr:hypothetical protein V056_00698 [Staphylococcus aureus MSSA-123]EZT75741.1 hypothetical protein V103_02515 [Staphylococcus aureus 22(2K81-5)]EZT85436.1 hypothetical protein V082_00028 [Staphylococcus aureus 2011-60-2275-7]EZV83614.1 hypothetical protein U890_00544 [Staphylococcus aureus 2011-60-2256-5]EZV90337.1 hypothetical protein V081_00026 [Staphylococcus aureus 2011-60-2275-1]EZW18124.1 hypothetical protein V105_00026 [Staphylococcus aureus 25(2889)]EZY43000.1 hypothetical protein V05
MYKIKDIETRINNKNVDIGDIGCRFYTEDENTAYVRIGINDEKGRINFKESNLTPKLHLFLEDGSIFKNEPVLIDDNAIKGDIWIEHRNADMGKIYNQQFKEETIEAGYEWQFKLNYRTTEIPYANTLI